MCGADNLSVVLDAIDEPYLLVTADGDIAYCNHRARQLASLTDRHHLAGPGGATGADVVHFLAKCNRSARSLRGHLSLAAPGGSGTIRLPCVGRRVQFASGATLILLRLRPGPDSLTAGNGADLRAAIRRAERSERARIARDLHDQAGQQVLCLKLGLARLRNACADEIALAAIDELMLQVDAVVTDLHRTIADLRPSPLDELGFDRALQILSEQWSRTSGIPVHFGVSGAPEDLNEHAEIALFRVLQEALTNIAKHATGVRAVTVTLRYAQGCATLKIRDDGNGFGMTGRMPAGLIQHGKLGLLGMHERLARLGGELELRSIGSGGKGTMVIARVQSTACQLIGMDHAV